MNTQDDELTLSLLSSIEKNSQSSQRELARHNGVALGLVNSYIKRCVKKGWIKITDAPANRYLYYLTPKGFSEKMRLTTRYFSDSFSFYRKATHSCDILLRSLVEQDKRSLVLAGASDLAEITVLKSLENEVSIIAVYDPDCNASRFLSVPVWKIWSTDQAVDAVLLTDIAHPDETYEDVIGKIGAENVFAPDILGLWSGYQIREGTRAG